MSKCTTIIKFNKENKENKNHYKKMVNKENKILKKIVDEICELYNIIPNYKGMRCHVYYCNYYKSLFIKIPYSISIDKCTGVQYLANVNIIVTKMQGKKIVSGKIYEIETNNTRFINM